MSVERCAARLRLEGGGKNARAPRQPKLSGKQIGSQPKRLAWLTQEEKKKRVVEGRTVLGRWAEVLERKRTFLENQRSSRKRGENVEKLFYSWGECRWWSLPAIIVRIKKGSGKAYKPQASLSSKDEKALTGKEQVEKGGGAAARIDSAGSHKKKNESSTGERGGSFVDM